MQCKCGFEGHKDFKFCPKCGEQVPRVRTEGDDHILPEDLTIYMLGEAFKIHNGFTVDGVLREEGHQVEGDRVSVEVHTVSEEGMTSELRIRVGLKDRSQNTPFVTLRVSASIPIRRPSILDPWDRARAVNRLNESSRLCHFIAPKDRPDRIIARSETPILGPFHMDDLIEWCRTTIVCMYETVKLIEGRLL